MIYLRLRGGRHRGHGGTQGSASGNPQGEPLYNPALHTSVWAETFESYADTAALVAAYVDKQTDGAIVLDTTLVPGTKSLRVDWSNGGCLGLSDGDVHIEKSWTNPATHRDWYYTYQCCFQAGFMHWWSAGGCARGNEHKEWVLWRPVTGSQADGKLTGSATTSHTAAPDIYGLPTSGDLRWMFSFQPTTAANGWADNTKPTAGGVSRYIQHLAMPGSAAPKDPDSISDGAFHRITVQLTLESTLDVGDGKVLMWVDGLEVMHYDGQNPSDPAFGLVYTRDRNFTIAWPIGIFNGGSPTVASPYTPGTGQSRWIDELNHYYRTAS